MSTGIATRELSDREVVHIFFGVGGTDLEKYLEGVVHLARRVDVDREDFNCILTASLIADAVTEKDPQRCQTLLSSCPDTLDSLLVANLPGLDQVSYCYLHDRIWQLALNILQARSYGSRL